MTTSAPCGPQLPTYQWQYQGPMTPIVKPCPNCGRCPHCGHVPTPHFTYTNQSIHGS